MRMRNEKSNESPLDECRTQLGGGNPQKNALSSHVPLSDPPAS
jgi:hypothetical protein